MQYPHCRLSRDPVPSSLGSRADRHRVADSSPNRLAEDLRYNERSGAERGNGRLKDDFGWRYVRVRDQAKVVLCHLMFGIWR
jgi:hypothetical protein